MRNVACIRGSGRAVRATYGVVAPAMPIHTRREPIALVRCAICEAQHTPRPPIATRGIGDARASYNMDTSSVRACRHQHTTSERAAAVPSCALCHLRGAAHPTPTERTPRAARRAGSGAGSARIGAGSAVATARDLLRWRGQRCGRGTTARPELIGCRRAVCEPLELWTDMEGRARRGGTTRSNGRGVATERTSVRTCESPVKVR